jgi:hypothetical protein
MACCRRSLPCLALATALVAAAAWAAGEPFVPAPELKEIPGGAPQLEGETWTDATPDYVIRAQRIDDAKRLAYIRHVTGLNTDPFAAPPGADKVFETFVVEIENRGAAELSFNPDASWLTSERQKDLLTPYGLDELGFDYRTAGATFPPAYQHAAKALLQYPTLLAPGDRLDGLIVFRAVPKRSRTMQLELSITLASGDRVAFAAPYRRLTRKEVEAAEKAGEAPE